MLLLPWEDEPVVTGAHLLASQLGFKRERSVGNAPAPDHRIGREETRHEQGMSDQRR